MKTSANKINKSLTWAARRGLLPGLLCHVTEGSATSEVETKVGNDVAEPEFVYFPPKLGEGRAEHDAVPPPSDKYTHITYEAASGLREAQVSLR